MPKMTDSELIAILDEHEQDAALFNGEFMRDNEKALKYYLAEPFGDEVEDRSQVVSTDVQDVVDADMASMARIFLGSGDIVTFQPSSDRPEDQQEAEDKTTYIDWIVRHQPNSYKTLHDWIKDAEIQKMGVVKYFIEDTVKSKEVSFTGLAASELQEAIDSLRDDDVSKIEVTEHDENERGEFDVKFRVTRGKQETKIINIPTESFLISRNASCIDDASLVGDRVVKTRGQLLAEGNKRDFINQLPTIDDNLDRQTTLKSIRLKDQGGESKSTLKDWASEEVEIKDLYVLVDYDGDGIAERRHIMKSGNHIIENEAFDHVPYASMSGILMPNRAIGRSRAEITMTTQRIKSVLYRQMLDNTYMASNGRNAVNSDRVEIDDLLTVRPNGIVRVEGDPASAIVPLVTPYIGQQTLQVIQYVDSARSQSTGSLLASQGLDADNFHKETATRFEGVEQASEAKVELVARNYAETGFRKLYEGIAWMVAQFQDTETEIFVLGKALTVNPANWRYNHNVISQVGLGSGDDERLVDNMSAILGIHQQLAGAGSVLTDQKKVYNTLARVVKGLGLPRVDEFFNDPEKPDELLQAENDQLKQALQQMQAQVQQLQNPLAEAEQIKAQAQLQNTQLKEQVSMLKEQGKQGIEVAKLQENARQFNVSTAQDANQFGQQQVVDLTKLELDSGQNVPGAAV